MHELALCRAVADAVARAADGQRVHRVELRIGHFRQVVPDSLQFSWKVLTENTPLSGCELAIDHVPAVIACDQCGTRSTLDWPILVCAHCDGTDVTLVSGEEFLITSIDRAVEVP